MVLYMISYDLRNVRNYDPLIQQLRDWGCVRPLESVWLANLNGSITAIRDALAAHMDDDDGLLVVELKAGSLWATKKVATPAVEWLKKYLAP